MNWSRVRRRTSAAESDAIGAGRITLGYLLIGVALLIVVEVVLATTDSTGLRIAGQLLFVAATGTVLMVLSRRELRRRRQTEQQVENAQRLEALGRLAGGVAHDFNNLLTVILGYSELVQKRLPEDDPSFDDLNAVRRAGEKAQSLVSQLLTLSNRGVTNPVVHDPNDTVASLSEVLRRVLGPEIDLHLDTAEVGKVMVDPSQLGQILLNLVVNARDAFSGPGEVSIATIAGQMSDGRAAAVITVTDTGQGMDPETARRCFEPFFTARANGEGTGLGLAIVYGAVSQAEGEISVASAPGQGTTFTMRLPHVGEPGVVDIRVPDGSATDTILLVDDDDAVRSFAERVLTSGGYQVIEASSAKEAIEVIERAGLPRLVITDIVMPSQSGLELAEHLTAVARDTPVLLISGFIDDPELRSSGANAGLPLLRKPFHPTELLQAASDAMSPPTQP